MIIHTTVNARAGLLGNPSDIYGGKVISFLIEDFSASVRLWESPLLTFRQHPDYDRAEFENVDDFITSMIRHGYYGMQRVLFATCRRFVAYCQENDISLRRANFTIEYDTNIPRQSGLGGSSAIIIAALQALKKFYRLPAELLPPAELAALALSVETKELGIAAGLQDRVVQSYGGLTYMDFSMPGGNYQRLDSNLLPRFGLAWVSETQLGSQESGQVHTPMRVRWEQSDPEVHRIIPAIAECAQQGLEALRQRDTVRLGQLMQENYELRQALFGVAGPEQHNIRLVDIAQRVGFAAKLSGSGGAVIILLANGQEEGALAQAYAAEGYRYRAIRGK